MLQLWDPIWNSLVFKAVLIQYAAKIARKSKIHNTSGDTVLFQDVGLLALVSWASPIPFCSTNRFQYQLADTESNRCCTVTTDFIPSYLIAVVHAVFHTCTLHCISGLVRFFITMIQASSIWSSCLTQFARYTCPRCNIRYCSVVCYKSKVNSAAIRGPASFPSSTPDTNCAATSLASFPSPLPILTSMNAFSCGSVNVLLFDAAVIQYFMKRLRMVLWILHFFDFFIFALFFSPQKHAQCSESFYRDCFMTELQQRKGRYYCTIEHNIVQWHTQEMIQGS